MSFKPATAKDRLILALDVPTVDEARTIISQTQGLIGTYKIGMQLQFAGGLALAEELAAEGHSIFLDVKLLDIDNTIASAVKNVAKMGVKFMTLHAYPKAMRAAVGALQEAGNKDLCLLGVTVLTSMDEADLKAAGYVGPIADLVVQRAAAAAETGMGGIVCSPVEAEKMRAAVGDKLAIITPGVRPSGSDAGDQKRIMTPADAIRAGSDYLVIGRPIVQASDRRAAAEAILKEVEAAVS